MTFYAWNWDPERGEMWPRLYNIYNKHLNLVDVFHIPQAVGEGNHSIESWYTHTQKKKVDTVFLKGEKNNTT